MYYVHSFVDTASNAIFVNLNRAVEAKCQCDGCVRATLGSIVDKEMDVYANSPCAQGVVMQVKPAGCHVQIYPASR